MPVGPQYTKCVQPENYKGPDFTAEAVAVVAAAIAFGPAGLVAAGPAVMSILEKVLRYMLEGKLVCLGSQECSLGWIAGFETTADKDFPDNIDNDFSINIVLSPDTRDSFLVMPFPTEPDPESVIKKEVLSRARSGPQGKLVSEQASMPEPREPLGGWGHYAGYFHAGPGSWTWQPVMHLECEGSRIRDMLETLEWIGSLGTGGKICRLKLGPFAIGKVICAVVAAALAPILIAALIKAWFGAAEGDVEDALRGGGPVQVGDLVVSTGRWVYDAGHGGYNEIHAVRTIQVIDRSRDFGAPGTVPWGSDFATYRKRWCEAIAEAPPRQPADAVAVPATPAQQETANRQARPEHQWNFHPVIDGCLPREEDQDAEGGVIVH